MNNSALLFFGLTREVQLHMLRNHDSTDLIYIDKNERTTSRHKSEEAVVAPRRERCIPVTASHWTEPLFIPARFGMDSTLQIVISISSIKQCIVIQSLEIYFRPCCQTTLHVRPARLRWFRARRLRQDLIDHTLQTRAY